jgi:DNA-binding NtrC family response regulator
MKNGNANNNTPAEINKAINYNRESYILVVDDDQTLLKFFKIHLNKFFSRVIVVKSVREALITMKEKQIDLVISDIRMPKTTGLQLIKKVRNHEPTIPVFLISGALLTEDQIQEVDLYADGFLKKPFSVDELHSFIERGLSFRGVYQEMDQLINNRKFFVDFLKKKHDLTKIRDVDVRSAAMKLYEKIKIAC